MKPDRLPSVARCYIGAVIGAGAVALAVAWWSWTVSDPGLFVVYLALSLLSATLKVRLPGITGTYSLSFLFLLLGVMYFSLAGTLVAGCGAALVQSLWKAKQRPTVIQILFNMANISLTSGVCFLLVHSVFAAGMQAYRPAVLAVVAAVYYVLNTSLVSGILCLLGTKTFGEVSAQWYFSSFVYYLIGAVLVGLLPLAGQHMAPEAWLMLVPPLYLAHFYGVLTMRETAGGTPPAKQRVEGGLPAPAQFYIGAVVAAGATVLAFAAMHWDSPDLLRFGCFALAALLASACKVRLPRMTSTISLGFVLLLLAASELRFSEAVMLGGMVGAFQTLWKPARRPKSLQVLFNAACLTLSTALAHTVCQVASVLTWHSSAPILLAPASVVFYASNTVMVAAVLCLVDGQPLVKLWERCNFWSFPYYLVGAAVAAVMVLTSRQAGWQPSLLMLPLMGLVYLSFRLQVGRSTQGEASLATRTAA